MENDGVLELQSASSSAFVYAFSADVDTTGIGQVFYRETTDPSLLSEVTIDVQTVFPDLGPFNITSLFIATWFYVGYFDNNVDRVCNTGTMISYRHRITRLCLSCRPTPFSVLLAQMVIFLLLVCCMLMR